MGFNCLKATEPLQGGSLLSTKFPEIPGTCLIDLGKIKGWVNFGAKQWFWTRDHWIGHPVQRVKIHSSSSTYLELLQGIMQRSVLGPPLFNLLLCDWFFFVEEANITSYTDDNNTI